ncbi:Protein kinase and PP2C-like domain-containing protein [Linum perenne]
MELQDVGLQELHEPNAQAHTVLEMNYTEEQLTAVVVSGKLRPALATSESGASPSLLSLIQRCWDDNPDHRPSFSDIVLELDTMIGQELLKENYSEKLASRLHCYCFVDSNLKERERVVSAGGEVKWQVDTWRVGLAALQVTRSIGDNDLKPAVTAELEVTETILTEDDEFLVMASDGLWDCVRNDEVVRIIRDTVQEPTMCSKRLATEAAERGSNDNITVIIVFQQPVSTAERVY